MTEPDLHDERRRRVQALLSLYEGLRTTTAEVRLAVEQGHGEDLEALVTTRAASLREADDLLRDLGQDAALLPPAARETLLDALTTLRDEDESLRALISARVQELPAQLAELRVARRLAAGYGEPPPNRPAWLDRRG